MRAYIEIYASTRGVPTLSVFIRRFQGSPYRRVKELSFGRFYLLVLKIEKLMEQGRCKVLPLTDGRIGWEARFD